MTACNNGHRETSKKGNSNQKLLQEMGHFLKDLFHFQEIIMKQRITISSIMASCGVRSTHDPNSHSHQWRRYTKPTRLPL
jgi:hypothetical protein